MCTCQRHIRVLISVDVGTILLLQNSEGNNDDEECGNIEHV